MNSGKDNPVLLNSDPKKGIFSEESLCTKDLEILSRMVHNLRQKISEIRAYVKGLEEIKEDTLENFSILRQNTIQESMSVSTGSDTPSSKLLMDMVLFLGHDFAQLADYVHGRYLNSDLEDLASVDNVGKYREYLYTSHASVLACFENCLSILTGENNLESSYRGIDLLDWFQDVLTRRFYLKDKNGIITSQLTPESQQEYLKRRGLLDRNGISVYEPFRLHTHCDPSLTLPGSVGATLLISMYNWAKNSITTGEMRGGAYYNFIKDPIADAYAELLQKRITENKGVIDVHMEVFATEEAYIGCVSDTGAGFDLNVLKNALRELTKDENRMAELLRLGILSKEMVKNIKDWDIDPRAYGRILPDLPSLLKLPRFSSANSAKLNSIGLGHSGVGLFGIEAAAREHFATTFITEQKNGGACMIMVIPKDPKKYRKTIKGSSDTVRKKVGDALFQTPEHLMAA